MPPKQPKKGKGKKVTVTDPTSAPAPAPAAPPNPEVQAVLDAHIANVGSEHFPGGYFPIPYTLTSPDAESFPQLPPLREPLEAALFGKWDQPGNPHLVWRIDATRVNFALTRGVLSRFFCAVMGRYPTTLAVELPSVQGQVRDGISSDNNGMQVDGLIGGGTFGARQVASWRAKSGLGAPTCEFARAQAREANFGTFVPCRSVFSTRGA